MSHDLICNWLGLPPNSWPPTHYVLLGLAPDETDVQKIEERVHERLLKLRQYQLNQPDQATEAMNRVAQAFACLTDPEARRAYDTQLRAPQAEAQAVAVAAAPAAEPLAITPDEQDPLAWLFGPWGQGEALGGRSEVGGPAVPREFSAPALKAVDWNKEPPPPRVNVEQTPANVTPAVAAVAETSPTQPEQTRNPIAAIARYSPLARRGLGTRRALYYRIAYTRELHRHWQRVGKYLGKPTKRLTKVSEATELSRHLAEILDLLPEFPQILGNAGQPGYLVTVLARQPIIVPTFRKLSLEQREILAKHWQDGDDLLVEHLRFLREEARRARKRTVYGRWLRAAGATIADRPEAILAFLALLALSLAFLSWLSFSRSSTAASPNHSAAPTLQGLRHASAAR